MMSMREAAVRARQGHGIILSMAVLDVGPFKLVAALPSTAGLLALAPLLSSPRVLSVRCAAASPRVTAVMAGGRVLYACVPFLHERPLSLLLSVDYRSHCHSPSSKLLNQHRQLCSLHSHSLSAAPPHYISHRSAFGPSS